MASVAGTRAAGPPSRVRRWLSGFRERETWTAYLFILPWVIGFLALTAGPMFASLYFSFTDYGVQQIAGIEPTSRVGLDNYRELLNDPKVAMSLKNTLIYTVMTVPAKMCVALGLALILARLAFAAGFFRTVFYLPVMTPAVAVGIMYLLLFNGSFGLVNDALGMIGITGPFWTTDPLWVKPGLVLIIHVWAVGASVVILLAAIVGVPRHLYEAASMDGASRWRQFRDVTLPMISPALFFIVIINTISSLQTFDQVYTAFFNQSTPYGTDASLFYVIYLFQEAFTFFRMGYASALAWILFVVIMVVTVVQILVSRRFVYYEGERR
jgi:multiple sugar transport system permease protein